jgi:hypothetical protein
MFFPASGWFAAFLVTVAIEIPIVVVLVRRVEPDAGRVAVLTLFANLATHPIVWFVITQLVLVGTLGYTVVAESWAVVAEAVFYRVAIRGLSSGQALLVAVVANGASFLAGLLIGTLWPGLFT